MNAPLRKGDARIRHRGPGSRRTNCELYGPSPTHSPYNRWLRDDWWFHIPSFPLIQFYTCITGNLPWPTAGNTETGGRQKRTTCCFISYGLIANGSVTSVLHNHDRYILFRRGSTSQSRTPSSTECTSTPRSVGATTRYRYKGRPLISTRCGGIYGIVRVTGMPMGL